MKYLFLVLGAGIFVTSLGAYRDIGADFGPAGAVMGIAVFLLVQGFELKPIFMTNGGAGPIQILGKAVAQRRSNATIADPEELLDAVDWALLGYAIDFVAGLFVWPVISSFDLLRVGGLTMADINWRHIAQILACVFLLQICIQQYLARGGKVPGFLGGSRHAN